MTTTQKRDYRNLDDETGLVEPMTCGDCGRPIYYDYQTEGYHHAFDAANGCFLIRSEDRPDDPNHPYYHHWIETV